MTVEPPRERTLLIVCPRRDLSLFGEKADGVCRAEKCSPAEQRHGSNVIYYYLQDKADLDSEFLEDEGFHEIYEALFRCAKIERTAYLGTAKSPRSTAAANRLRDCASTFRLAVELGVSSITSTTANAVLDHVVDTLPSSGEEYCVPLADEYLKIFLLVVSYAPHVEHLRPTRWGNIVDFLLGGISKNVEAAQTTPGESASSSGPFSRSEHTASFRVSQSSGSRVPRADAGRPIEELLLCLDRLTVVANAPTMSRAAEIMQCLRQVFNSSVAGASLLQAAFKCVNNVLSILVTEQTTAAHSLVLQMVSIIRRLWSPKNHLLRDEMLVTLVLGSDIISALPPRTITEDLQSSLWNLSEGMSVEYGRRNEKDILQLDEVSLGKNQHQQVMSLERIRVRPEHTRATYNWSTLGVLASITMALYGVETENARPGAESSRVKRRKVTTAMGEIMEQALSDSSSNKIRALQLIPFLQCQTPAITDIFLHTADRFSNQVLDEDASVAAWTMVALAR